MVGAFFPSATITISGSPARNTSSAYRLPSSPPGGSDHRRRSRCRRRSVATTDLLAAGTGADAAGASPHTASFSVLGGQILVRARHVRCLAGIEEHFSAARSEPWTTPDHIIA